MELILKLKHRLTITAFDKFHKTGTSDSRNLNILYFPMSILDGQAMRVSTLRFNSLELKITGRQAASILGSKQDEIPVH